MLQQSLDIDLIHEEVFGTGPFPIEYADDYLFSVWMRWINKDNLSVDWHNRTVFQLVQGLEKGFNGGAWPEFTEEGKTFAGLEKNIYIFSAAKQYQQVRQMSHLLGTLNENAVFTDFRDQARALWTEFNENYLRTEFNTAVAQAQSAREWLQIEADQELFPLLEYVTQSDGRVRPEHVEMEGTVKPVNDPFWSNFYPPNGWNCRCFVNRLLPDQKPISKTPDVDLEEVPELFRMNAGKDKYVFNPAQHPYFKVARGDAPLKARNFNMPMK